MDNWVTLEDYVIRLFEETKTNTLEFKALVKVYGREKLVEIFKRYKEKKVHQVK